MPLNLPTHGVWCGSRTIPWNCRYCGDSVFFYSCADHGSRVCFEELGNRWPIHNCSQWRASTARRPRDSVFEGALDNSYAESVRRHRASSRDTVRMEPASDVFLTILGVVDSVTTFSALERLGIGSGILAAEQIVRKFSGEKVTQVTVRVDDLDVDPQALDYKGYTFWIESST